MNTQKPAQGIMQTGDWSDARSYRIACNCHSTDHDVNMWIEVNRDSEDPKLADVEVSFYVTTWTPLWEGWTEKFKAVYEILFKGVHKQEHHMILNKQSAINLADTIKTSVKELE
jgi:hypothetical protein